VLPVTSEFPAAATASAQPAHHCRCAARLEPRRAALSCLFAHNPAGHHSRKREDKRPTPLGVELVYSSECCSLWRFSKAVFKAAIIALTQCRHMRRLGGIALACSMFRAAACQTVWHSRKGVRALRTSAASTHVPPEGGALPTIAHHTFWLLHLFPRAQNLPCGTVMGLAEPWTPSEAHQSATHLVVAP
jgi:hypothetical protein